MTDDIQTRIRNRAYEIWESQGRSGNPEDHWLEAEREFAGGGSTETNLAADAIGGPDPTAGVHAADAAGQGQSAPAQADIRALNATPAKAEVKSKAGPTSAKPETKSKANTKAAKGSAAPSALETAAPRTSRKKSAG